VHAVLSAQSALLLQVAQTPPGQAWVMQEACVQLSDPEGAQKPSVSQEEPAQSVPAAQGSPPPRPHTPPSDAPPSEPPVRQCMRGQSVSVAHAVQTFPTQRPLSQVTL
jgi:hypothetical protein